LSLCSVAISSSTGAIILQGPHQVAQKSTSTGLSLASTSSLKLESVTLTVSVMVPLSVSLGLVPREIGSSVGRSGGVAAAHHLGRLGGLADVRVLGEPALGIDGRGAATARRRDGLLIGVVHEVACGEPAVDVRVGAAALGAHVARRVD